MSDDPVNDAGEHFDAIDAHSMRAGALTINHFLCSADCGVAVRFFNNLPDVATRKCLAVQPNHG